MTDIIKKNVLDFRKTKFVTSAPDITKLPEDMGAEIAIIGVLIQENHHPSMPFAIRKT